MAQSVLLLCIISQIPWVARISTFVVNIAVIIMIISGTLARRVIRPNNTSAPQTISEVPTKNPRNSGEGNPIFSKRPAPRMAGNRNFCIPSERNTAPTIMRMSMVDLELSVSMIFLIRPEACAFFEALFAM